MNTRFKRLGNYILERLSEPSTWRGIIATITGLGVMLDPAKTDAYVSIGLTTIGLINVLRKESPNER